MCWPLTLLLLFRSLLSTLLCIFTGNEAERKELYFFFSSLFFAVLKCLYVNVCMLWRCCMCVMLILLVFSEYSHYIWFFIEYIISFTLATCTYVLVLMTSSHPENRNIIRNQTTAMLSNSYILSLYLTFSSFLLLSTLKSIFALHWFCFWQNVQEPWEQRLPYEFSHKCDETITSRYSMPILYIHIECVQRHYHLIQSNSICRASKKKTHTKDAKRHRRKRNSESNNKWTRKAKSSWTKNRSQFAMSSVRI